MDAKVTIAVIAGVFGLIGGVVGSLVAPWVQWGIEKKRFKLHRRLKYIRAWRQFIGSNEFNQAAFRETTTYKTLRPHLSRELIEMIEDDRVYTSFTGGDPIRSGLLDQITRIERDWGLV